MGEGNRQAGPVEYREFVERSPTGIYVDQEGKIVFANKRFADIYGYTVDEITGAESRHLVYHEETESTDHKQQNARKGKRVSSGCEMRGLRKNGEVIWLKCSSRYITFRGQPALLGNVTDITEIKNREEESKQFLYAVSHDLKNPIVAIQGFSRRLRKKYGKDLGEKGLQYVNHISTSACQMEQLVSDLLTLSRLGRMKLEYEDVPVSEVLKEVMTDLRNQIRESGVNIRLEKELPVVRCDPTKLYQVFQNLLSNAIKYTSASPNPEVTVGHQDNGAFHRFYVRDNGIGIDPKDHEKIFKMLARANGSEHQEGTGLGLSIVEKIVAGHGGEVGGESQKGKGATFHFTLPK